MDERHMKLKADRKKHYRPYFLAASAFLILGATTLAQEPAIPSPDSPEFGEPIRVSVSNVIAPVLVTDHGGNVIDGLQQYQFHLYDNGIEQNIRVDSATIQPISLVVAIEKSARVEAILPKLHTLGILLSQITGKDGEAAVVTFDCKLTTPQDFTKDNDKIIVAINNIKPGCSGTRVIDAVEQGIFMLRRRPASNRRIILLVSETRDEGSAARLKEVNINAALQNVQVEAVDISQLDVRLNQKQDDPRPVPYDVASQNFPMGVASTPTTVEQNYGMANRAQFVPLLKEIFIDTKGIFVRDPATQLARATGGDQFVFLRQKGLEEAVQKISSHIHSQYLVSYNPSNRDEGGYHTIAVTIDREPGYVCKTRPGYWIGGGAQ
jgi:VWFA-related protein